MIGLEKPAIAAEIKLAPSCLPDVQVYANLFIWKVCVGGETLI